MSYNNPLNVSIVMGLWVDLVLSVSEALAPVGRLSLLHSSLVASRLSSLRLGYYGEQIYFGIDGR